MVEQRTENPRVVSSILTLGTRLRSDIVGTTPSKQFLLEKNSLRGVVFYEIKNTKPRSVAQLARALRLGRRGRRFESFHSDENFLLVWEVLFWDWCIKTWDFNVSKIDE